MWWLLVSDFAAQCRLLLSSLASSLMGNLLPRSSSSSSGYITPCPKDVQPDPAAGPCTFLLSRNALLSSNFNVYKGGQQRSAPLWLFLHARGIANGFAPAFLVLENFWRPPFSVEGDVLCWCQLPAFQRNGAYSSTGIEEHGVAHYTEEIFWSGAESTAAARAQEEEDRSPHEKLFFVRREWSFFVRVGFYRDRYMEEPLGVLEVSSKGWIVRDGTPATAPFLESLHWSKELREVRYVFGDKQGRRFPIELDTSRKDCFQSTSFDSCMFSCSVAPSWNGDKLSVSTRPGFDASLGLLVGFVCGHILSPQSILSNLRISQLRKKCS